MDIVRISFNVNGQQQILVPDRSTGTHSLSIEQQRSYRERMYNIAYNVFFSLDPDKVKRAEILYSTEFAEAIKNHKQSYDYNRLKFLKNKFTIESYVVDRARSRDISIDELEEAIDYLIEYNEKRIANGDAAEFPTGVEYKNPNHPAEWAPSWEGSKESPLTNYILHLYSRVAHYSQSFPMNWESSKGNYAFFDANDQMNILYCTPAVVRKKYDLHNYCSKEKMHVFYTFKRLIQKDKLLRQEDPRCILHNLTYHPGFERRYTINKLKMCIAVVSALGLTSLALYKSYLKYFSAH